LKTPVEMLDGFQLAKTSAEKSVSEEHPLNARYILFPVGNGVPNDNRPLLRHAEKKFTLVASVPSRASLGNDVRDEQAYHAFEKFVPDEASIDGKDVREMQPFHELVKFNPDEVSIKGNDVREPQAFHVLMKFVPILVSISGKEVRDIHDTHA
jgi:hypothetical protein